MVPQAMIATKTARKDMSKMLQFIKRAEPVNVEEACGIIKWALLLQEELERSRGLHRQLQDVHHKLLNDNKKEV